MTPAGLWEALTRAAAGRPWQASVWEERGIRVEGGDGETAVERWRESYLSVRLDLGGGRVGFAAVPLGPGSRWDAGELVAWARQAAEAQDPVPAADLEGALGPSPSGDLGIRDSRVEAITAADLAGVVQTLERTARARDRRVVSVRKPSAEAVVIRRMLRNHRAEEVAWVETSASASLEVSAAEGGTAQTGWASAEVRQWAEIAPERLAADAADRAVELLGARPAPTGRFPLILDARVAADLLGVLAPSFLGETVEKGLGLFRERGEVVAARGVTIRDEGLRPGGIETRPVDEEGVPRQNTAVVEQGVLKGFLYDRPSGRRAGRDSTGNAAGGAAVPPRPDVTNLIWAPGDGGGAADLMALAGRGLWVREVLGLHTADPVTGEFSVGCSGVWFEEGTPAHPVTGAALSGTVGELLLRVAVVGTDLEAHGGFGAPPVLVEGLDLAG
ncbi:TldD/PmbA family protein [Deferrisoma camini]|uniref:TldD/PmbA family protein n=1 Tax=Deferrisoma camini TaxID=1035120 RepID=UPI00046D4382|nr:metallopeptidase TldD-related protein [Deferrisoma camini]